MPRTYRKDKLLWRTKVLGMKIVTKKKDIRSKKKDKTGEKKANDTNVRSAKWKLVNWRRVVITEAKEKISKQRRAKNC